MKSSETCELYTDIYSDPANHVFTILFFALLYSVVFVLGLAGNLGLIVATVRHRSLQTVQNIFIVNLAIADVILCLLSIPLTPVTHMVKQCSSSASASNAAAAGRKMVAARRRLTKRN